MAASSFGGTNMRIELDPGTGAAPEWERQAYAATRHIPGGDLDATQVLGRGTPTITLRLWLTSAEYAAFTARLLTQATLIMAGTSYADVLLESVSAVTRFPTGHASLTATFRQVG